MKNFRYYTIVVMILTFGVSFVNAQGTSETQNDMNNYTVSNDLSTFIKNINR